MLLRRRITLVAATTVALAVAVAVVVSYFAVRNQVLGQIDQELTAQAAQIQGHYQGPRHELPGLNAGAGGSAPYYQGVLPNGAIITPPNQMALPDTKRAASVAAGTSPAFMADVEVNGARLRVYTFQTRLTIPYEQMVSIAFQLARPLAAADNVLSTLRWILALLFVLVVALAAGLARIATRRVLAPLAAVTATAQTITETDDLTQRIDVHRDDEVGRLADRFNAMLERLEHSRAELDASVGAQRQLVADASHELRTPITSLRTNIEVLRSGAVLEDEDRERLLTDVIEQTEELSALVNDLIDVGRGDTAPAATEVVRLDSLVEDALDRARRNTPGAEFSERLTPVSIKADPDRILRAVNNLLDNAALHAGHGGPIEVTVDGGAVTVRDHGDGIPADDLPHVFDRFYRGASSRARQGTGLGLAIVKQAAEQHGGSVSAANAPDGGAVFTLRLPTASDADGDAEQPAPSDPEPSVAGSVQDGAR